MRQLPLFEVDLAKELCTKCGIKWSALSKYQKELVQAIALEAEEEARNIIRGQRMSGAQAGPAHEREEVSPSSWREPGLTDYIFMLE